MRHLLSPSPASILRLSSVSIVALLLSACGGGGGDAVGIAAVNA
jgi:hypothetical protein